MKCLTIARNIEFSQSKNCWLYIQIRTTAFYFWRWWRKDNTGEGFRIELGVPKP